ncbi:MAG: class I SAM-dependent methyltransferase [Nocardioides sp.]
MDAVDWDQRYAAVDLMWSSAPNQFVVAECAQLVPGRALDLAAGEGRHAIWLAEGGWRVTAVDFSQVALDRGRARALSAAITWECADATRWHSRPVHDLALIAYLQLPAGERAVAIGTAFDSLVVGGSLVLIGHDSTNLTEGSGGPQDAGVLYTAQDVLGDLADRSFEMVRAERVERSIPGEHRATGVALDCLVHLVRRATDTAV